MSILLAVVIGGCSSDKGTEEKPDSEGSTVTRGEHDRDDDGRHDDDGGHGEEGEESGTELALNESYDAVRNGVRLILAYDAQSNSLQRHGGEHHGQNLETSSS